MTFYFLDDVFLLHFALKAPKRVFQGLTFLNPYLCQLLHTPKPVPSWACIVMASFWA